MDTFDFEAEKQRLQQAGWVVTPNESGGFTVTGPTMTGGWAMSERWAWAMAYAYDQINKDNTHG